MLSSRTGMRGRPSGRRWSVQAALALLGLFAGTGCQVEYAGMTLPSGKYFHDDVQYFATGPEFPYANTQAATQRARMQAAGIPVPPVPGSPNMTIGGAGIGPNGMPVTPAYAPGATPRLNSAPEVENLMPGGASAPPTPVPPSPAPDPGAIPGPVAAPPG